VTVFHLESYFMLAVALVLTAVKIFAAISALLYSTEAYRAADKLTKPAWCAILGLGAICQILIPGPINIINLAFTIAAFVYIADVRPALAGLYRR
jgi:hypothetical protein